MNPFKDKAFWPGYIPPENDELFSSWLVRLAYEHRIKTYSFSKFYFNSQPIWNRDIDKLFPCVIRETISKYTNLKPERIKNMFLVSYKDVVFNDSELESYTSGILNLGIYHRKRKQYGLLYCPSCLALNIPYYRKSWRLSFSLGCSKCRCHLLDACPNCQYPIAFHRLETGHKNDILKHPLYQCWNCHYDLRKSKQIYPPNSIIDRYQKYVDSTIRQGYNNITNYSFTYFKVLNCISKKILSTSKNWSRVKDITESYFKINILIDDKKIQYHRLKERKEALLLSYRILERWPHTFLKVFNNTNIRFSDFSKDTDNLPFWFKKVFAEMR